MAPGFPKLTINVEQLRAALHYEPAPRERRALLTVQQDKRIAQANMARMDAQADAADVALAQVVRIVKQQCWHRYSGYTANKDGYTVDFYDGSKIRIDRNGSVDWGSFTFQQAAE